MGLLAWLFNYVPRTERDGISLEMAGVWEISPVKDAATFFRSLPDLLPPACNLYVEGTYDPTLAEWLAARAAAQTSRVAVGTIWPRPDRHHIPATEQNLLDLARFLDSKALAYPCSHIHVYCGGTMIVQWHDPFDEPLYVAAAVNETNVKQFCKNAGCTYTRWGQATE